MGAIIWYVTIFGCALLFYGIGIYAKKIDKPMWFWSGSTVDADKITDIKSYNNECSRMWKIYSLWYWISGFAHLISVELAVVILILGCTIGIGILVKTYLHISMNYTIS